jgi:hypothetical protein
MYVIFYGIFLSPEDRKRTCFQWYNTGTVILSQALFNWYSGGWSPIGSNWVHSALRPPMPYCASPGWLWWWRNWWKPKYSEKTCPSAAFFTTNPTCCPDANPGRRGGKPARNRLSYGTASKHFLFPLILILPAPHTHLPSGARTMRPLEMAVPKDAVSPYS